MTKVSWRDVGGFVKTVMDREPPPFWTLRLVEDVTPKLDLHLLDHGFIVRRRKDSQTLEFDFPSPYMGVSVGPLDVEGLLRSVASDEDERNLFVVEGTMSSGVMLEIESWVKASDVLKYDVGVYGPGGKVVAYRTARGISADVTIRRRLNPKIGYWRDYKDILARLRCDCPDSTADLSLYAVFGYFELSKYEAQSLLRPVFLFSCEQPQDTEPLRPGWQVTIVEPATTSREFALQDGLGCWNE